MSLLCKKPVFSEIFVAVTANTCIYFFFKTIRRPSLGPGLTKRTVLPLFNTESLTGRVHKSTMARHACIYQCTSWITRRRRWNRSCPDTHTHVHFANDIWKLKSTTGCGVVDRTSRPRRVLSPVTSRMYRGKWWSIKTHKREHHFFFHHYTPTFIWLEFFFFIINVFFLTKRISHSKVERTPIVIIIIIIIFL